MAIMHRMRQNTKIILMILVFAFILTIIFSWGMGGFKGGKAQQGVIAEVNGDEISAKEFYESYQQQLDAYRQRTGSDPQGFQLQQLENRVYEQMVQREIIEDVIDRIGLKVTEEEIGEALWNNPPDILRNNPNFQDSTGAFDMQKYQAVLNNPAADEFWNTVIQYLRGTMPMQKFANFLQVSTVNITEADLRLAYRKRNQKAKVDYVLFNASDFAGEIAEPTQQELEAYYKEHEQDYHVNEKRVLDYILFELNATSADSAEVRDQAQDLLEQARAGEDFSELATIYSEDPGSAENGGDLGYFTRDQMVAPFSEAAFSADVGDIVGPVNSNFGLHIIKVDDKRVTDGEQEVKARHILLKFEPSPSTRENLREEATYIADTAEETGLQSVAEEEEITVQTTQPFEKEGLVPGIGMEPRVNRFAFQAEEGQVSDVITTQRGFLVAQLTEIQEEQIQPLEEVKQRVASSVKAEKRMQAAKQAAQDFYGQLQAGQSIDDAAAADTLEVQTTESFTMQGPVPGVGNEPRFIGTAFKLNVGDYSSPVEGAQGYYVLQIIDKTEIDPEEFQVNKEQLRQQLTSERQSQIFSRWYQEVKEQAKIKDYRDQMM